MAQHCINSQELLAEEMWPVFSLRKIDVYKMPSVSLKRHYYMIENHYIVIIFLFAYESIFFLFALVYFSVTIFLMLSPVKLYIMKGLDW